MANYFLMDCQSPLRKMHYTLQVESPARDKSWQQGTAFRADAEWDDEQPPHEPILVSTALESIDKDKFVYPELTWVPIPLMTRRLVAALRAAGIDNLQTFETRLSGAQDDRPAPEDFYLAVNIIGLISAVDPQKARKAPEADEAMISADYDALAIDAVSAHDLFIFRLAENTSAVIVHEKIKAAVGTAGIDSLTWLRPEEWAG